MTMTRTRSFPTTMSRRAALNTSMQALWPSWMPRMAFAAQGPVGDVLVCIFLRGGADGLNIIVPHGDPAYFTLRPTINLARPDQRSAAPTNQAIDLDGFFGVHPAMAPLVPLFNAHHLVAVHAAGSPDPTRSHFDAMSYMERGTPGDAMTATGWLSRHLHAINTGNTSPLRGVGWGDAVQDSLLGAVNVVSLGSILDYHLQGRDASNAEMIAALNALYAADDLGLKDIAARTQATIDLVAKIDIGNYRPANGATYAADDEFAQALKQTAALIKAQVGLEVAAIDLGGWDTHEQEGQDLPLALGRLSRGLAAFHADLLDSIGAVSLVVMSEFGRRAQENASAGTDHGHGNMLLVMGGHVAPQPVVATWPGLADEKLDDGDLAITTDFRDVLAEIVAIRLKNPQIAKVFPNYSPKTLGVVRP